MPQDVVVAGSGSATQKIVMSQKVTGEFAIAPVVIERQRIPKRNKGKDIELLWRFEMETEDEIDVVLGQLGVGRMKQAGERVDGQAFEVKRLGRNLQPLDHLVFSRFRVRPQFDYGKFPAQHRSDLQDAGFLPISGPAVRTRRIPDNSFSRLFREYTV